MKLYKLLYKPLGLFYTPDKGHGNLSKIGKIYRIKPNPTQYTKLSVITAHWSGKQTALHKLIGEHFNINKAKLSSFNSLFNFVKVNPSDWDVVEIQTEITQNKTFLITSTTGNENELRNGFCIVFDVDENSAIEQFNLKYKFSILEIKELAYAPERGFFDKLIEITQPLIN